MGWADVVTAGAFVAGAIAGTAGTIRLLKYVLEYLRPK